MSSSSAIPPTASDSPGAPLSSTIDQSPLSSARDDPAQEEEEVEEEDIPEPPPKPTQHFITTHVLDQTSGLPAARLHATLTLTSTKSRPSYTATTHPLTGRISAWTPVAQNVAPLEHVLPLLARIQEQSGAGWKSEWSLVLRSGEYWERKRASEKRAGDKTRAESGDAKQEDAEEARPSVTFYPEIEVRFYVDPSDPRGHWHVPVLMGPYGYTTYRGS
jgi:5-hydroxyisourate hydrolase